MSTQTLGLPVLQPQISLCLSREELIAKAKQIESESAPVIEGFKRNHPHNQEALIYKYLTFQDDIGELKHMVTSHSTGKTQNSTLLLSSQKITSEIYALISGFQQFLKKKGFI